MSAELEVLVRDLRHIAAWHTPGGPTPQKQCPPKWKVCAQAADAIEALATPATAPAGAVPAAQGPVAWRHNLTHTLHDNESEVELGDADEWAEPLYLGPAVPAAQDERPTAWRYKYLGQWHLSDEMPGEGATCLTPLFDTPATKPAAAQDKRQDERKEAP